MSLLLGRGMPIGMVLISTQIIPGSGSTIVLVGIEPKGRSESEQIKFGFSIILVRLPDRFGIIMGKTNRLGFYLFNPAGKGGRVPPYRPGDQ